MPHTNTNTFVVQREHSCTWYCCGPLLHHSAVGLKEAKAYLSIPCKMLFKEAFLSEQTSLFSK